MIGALLRCGAAFADSPPVPAPTVPRTGPVRLGTIEVEASRDLQRDEAAAAEAEAPGFLTIIRVEDSSARAPSVAEVVQREAGVRVRSAGGLGSFSAVSIRGSDAAEVAVFLDGVPLNRAAGGGTDLALMPVDGLERIEIYRGMVPAELGGQAVGGAINLVSRKGDRRAGTGPRFSLGGGSFGTRSVVAGYGLGGRALHADASLAYRGSQGDFTYFDDNGNPNRRDGDHIATRRNNDFNQGSADVSLGGGLRNRWSLAAHGFLKDQGVPVRSGGTDRLAPTARLGTGRVLVEGTVERSGFPNSSVDLRAGAHVLFLHTSLKNPHGDSIGTGFVERSDADSIEGGLDARLVASPSRWDLFTLLFSGSFERYAPHDLGGNRTPNPSERTRIAVTAVDELRVLADRLVLVPSVRVDFVDSRTARDVYLFGAGAAGAQSMSGWLSPQLGLRYRATPWLTLKGSVGRALRVPTLYELFGDHAFVLARPGLQPEVSLGGDLGAVVDLKLGPVSFALEAAFFGRQVDNYIALLVGGAAVSYENVGTERFLGGEARARLHTAPLPRLGGARLALSFDYTFIHSQNETDANFPGTAGNLVPGIPEHKFDLRAEVALGPFTAWYELAYVSTVYLSLQQDIGPSTPPRALHAIGLRAGPFPKLPVSLSIEIANLADLRVIDVPLRGTIYAGTTRPSPLVDYQDYPLPGRALYATLTYQR